MQGTSKNTLEITVWYYHHIFITWIEDIYPVQLQSWSHGTVMVLHSAMVLEIYYGTKIHTLKWY